MIDGILPQRSSLDGQTVADEAAVLYVGMTRARDIVYLSHSEYDSRGRHCVRSSLIDRILPFCDTFDFHRGGT